MPTDKTKIARHFTRKHYVTIAHVIRDRTIAAPEDSEALIALAKELSASFKAEYPLFDGPRFLKLCGLVD